MSESTLYERLGGEGSIHALATTIFDKHMRNAAVSNRYVNSDRDDVIRLVNEFINAGTGGPEVYTGRDILATHRGINVSEEHFEALNEHGVGQREQEELLMISWSLKLISWSLKPDIVRV